MIGFNRLMKYKISTHTLTWSVTGGRGKAATAAIDFNSHAHVERDVTCVMRYAQAHYFNSHAHVERDMRMSEILGIRRISTHTLTWSVTDYPLEFDDEQKISTHTLTWSVTSDCKSCPLEDDISTHTLTWSVTNYYHDDDNHRRFQLTRSRGA